MNGWRTFLTTHYDRHVEELMEFLRFPSVSALSGHKDDVAETAQWLANHMRRIGLEGVRVFPTEGHPVVYGEWLHAPGAPTALIYGHYDVQPVDPLNLWTSAPFDPQVRDGRIYARGASDDKGQVMLHLQAIEAILQTEGRLPVNVKLIIEGEEEVGSGNLAPFVQEHQELLQCDVIVISDSAMIDHGLPTVCTGLRGIAVLELHVTTASSDLHSGGYGGGAPNANHVLAQLLAALHDAEGRVTVPGFYDDVAEWSENERRRLAALPFDPAFVAERIGIERFIGESDYTPLERMTIRPTLEINGMWGGFLGEGTKTVIPKEAHAKITCRLVPDQTPQAVAETVKRYLEQICPSYARLTVEIGDGGGPWRAQEGDPYVAAAERALRAAFQREPALAPTGGSIPVVETFVEALRVPIVMMGFAPPDANAHAPNESFPLETLRVGREAAAHFWFEVGGR